MTIEYYYAIQSEIVHCIIVPIDELNNRNVLEYSDVPNRSY